MGTLHPWECRIYIDTEFTDIAAPELVSLGMVAEDGREFYGELNDIPIERCSSFVLANVLPQLGTVPAQMMSLIALGGAVRTWMQSFEGQKQRPVICYDHPVDVELLWRLVGGRPAGWKEKLISQMIDHRSREEYFKRNGGRHHALHDARANRTACR
ncbi:hypothetical protein PI93_000085 [Pandoraea fibrosis]|uniref:Uncharacterized protein n=1 Tax=Pandoraea fibrosis TaxID=1891094 RepID=A0ABX6HKB4_9BURK|nr:hypothetical protein PJ20_000085 [Pandoraea fibrosis]QHF11223.1 hypothetical protein PI93_000085 [Pandoraea fibrosis]